MIPFNIPCLLGEEKNNLDKVFLNKKFSGDGEFTKQCHATLETLYPQSKALLTTSCTDALEMSAILSQIQLGDEVIMPSFTFVSSANAFVLRGAKIVFIDIDPKSMNMDPALIEPAITKKTKAIIAVHYAGWSCDMFEVQKIAKKHNLILIEDAAQAILSTFKGKLLGTFGTFSTLSFHETKNIHCGEGGAIIINDLKYYSAAEIIREKGTNRSNFLRGQVDKYTWVDVGSSFLPSEMNAAFLAHQLDKASLINARRLKLWDYYREIFASMKISEIEILTPPLDSAHNAHLFAVKVKDLSVRTELINHLNKNGISAVFHYVPLHSSPEGLKVSTFHGHDLHTTKESERLVRLPLYYSLKESEIEYICEKIKSFFS